MTYPRKNGKSEKSLIEYIEWVDSLVDSLEETPVDYVEAAKLLQKNRKDCAEWLKGKDTFWIVSEKGADDGCEETVGVGTGVDNKGNPISRARVR